MGQSVRQVARKKAQEAAQAKSRERQQATKRREALGIDVLTALAERDEAVRRYDEAAAVALAALLDGEGVAAADIEDWVPGLGAAEVRRLRSLETSSVDQPTAAREEDSGVETPVGY